MVTTNSKGNAVAVKKRGAAAKPKPAKPNKEEHPEKPQSDLYQGVLTEGEGGEPLRFKDIDKLGVDVAKAREQLDMWKEDRTELEKKIFEKLVDEGIEAPYFVRYNGRRLRFEVKNKQSLSVTTEDE